MKPKKLNV